MKNRNIIISCALALTITGVLGQNASATTNGWRQSNGSWHYYQNNTLKTGWIQDSGTWYYLSPSDGTMQTGWIESNGSWYYLDNSGAMLINTTVGSYVLDASGAWIGTTETSNYAQGKTPTEIAKILKDDYGFVKYNNGLLLSPYGKDYNNSKIRGVDGWRNYQITFGNCTENGYGVVDKEIKMWILQNDSETIKVFKDIINMAFPNKADEAYSIMTDFLNSGEENKTVYLNGKTVKLYRGTDNNHSVYWYINLQ